jgi:hypothetical protein
MVQTLALGISKIGSKAASQFAFALRRRDDDGASEPGKETVEKSHRQMCPGMSVPLPVKTCARHQNRADRKADSCDHCFGDLAASLPAIRALSLRPLWSINR